MRMAAYDAAMRVDPRVQQEGRCRPCLTGLRIPWVGCGDREINPAMQRSSPDPHADMEFFRFPVAHQDDRAAEAVVGAELQVIRQYSWIANTEPEYERHTL